ncbi:MAG: bifunctional diguanylate cyclase/phosphodiesterase [Actinomycetota bacterium]|nr:bifunctional diguanylate cyclase/phosphodiesterase [Actinomycetota bacterium]
MANRTLLLDRLELGLARAARLDSHLGLLFLDLDGFKVVNDRLGHGAGDRLLIETARRLKSAVRATDLVARLGGDEFVLVCEDVKDEASLIAIADAAATAVSAPWLLDGRRVSVTTSIGVRLAIRGERADVVLRDADVAMYEATTSGRSRWALFDTLSRTRAASRAELEADLRRGVVSAEFTAWYQPVVNMQTGKVTGAEALVRWQHPTRGLVMPADFILVAEECGLIGQVGVQMLTMACRQAAAWDFPRARRVMHVNTTAIELSTHGFPATVSSILDAAGLAPSTLCLEITERQMIDEHPLVQANLQELRRLGVALAIDDFGTEYSSFSYLRRLPVDVLKIDRSFVTEVADGARDAAIVAGIVAMARALGVRTIAEGVETVEQARALCRAGVDEAQGWLFAPPGMADAWPVVDVVTAYNLQNGGEQGFGHLEDPDLRFWPAG